MDEEIRGVQPAEDTPAAVQPARDTALADYKSADTADKRIAAMHKLDSWKTQNPGRKASSGGHPKAKRRRLQRRPARLPQGNNPLPMRNNRNRTPPRRSVPAISTSWTISGCRPNWCLSIIRCGRTRRKLPGDGPAAEIPQGTGRRAAKERSGGAGAADARAAVHPAPQRPERGCGPGLQHQAADLGDDMNLWPPAVRLAYDDFNQYVRRAEDRRESQRQEDERHQHQVASFTSGLEAELRSADNDAYEYAMSRIKSGEVLEKDKHSIIGALVQGDKKTLSQYFEKFRKEFHKETERPKPKEKTAPAPPSLETSGQGTTQSRPVPKTSEYRNADQARRVELMKAWGLLE